MNDIDIRNEIRFLGKPLTILFAIVGLLSGTLYLGINKIKEVRAEMADLKNTINVLTKKALILEKVSEVVPGDITFIDLALPSKSAVLYGIAQIKLKSIENNLIVANFKSGANSDDSSVTKNSISFDVEGNESDIFAFLDSLPKSLPLMEIDKLEMNRNANFVAANVTLNVFSAEYPKVISSITSPITELSSKEINLLTELAQYSLPPFIEPQANINPEKRLNPFGD